MSLMNDFNILTFKRDTTMRWSLRKGDYLLWIRWTDVFDMSGDSLRVLDIWEIKDGDYVTITNRIEDLPPWFELHPKEVCNSLVYKMLMNLENGYKPPDEPIDGPNIWRLNAGDRLAWVGESRPENKSNKGVIAILDFHECGLAIGETHRYIKELKDIYFGAPSKKEPSRKHLTYCHMAVYVVRQMGLPSTTMDYLSSWAIG